MGRLTMTKVCAVALSLCVLLSGVAAKGGPSGSPTPSPTSGKTTVTTTTFASPPPPPPAAAAATAATAATTAAKAPPPAAASTTTAASGVFNPLVSPFGDKCTFATTGSPITVNNYPSSPFSTKNHVFVNKFQELKEKTSTMLTKTGSAPCREDGVCMDGYQISIEEFMSDVTGLLPGTQCKQVPLLGYDAMTPGPLIIGRTGVQDVTRFTNNIPKESKFFPPAGPGDRGGEGEKDLCAERADRYQEREFNGTKLHGGASNVTRGFGRATVTHHHGMASTSSMDGWAEQFFCNGESKDYVLPNNRAAGLYYHDHAVGITSANTYAGLTGMRLTRPCPGDDPYNVEPDASQPLPAVPEHHLVLQDFVLEKPRAGEAGICRRRYDRTGVHKDQLWGDINVVNGVPWPVLDVKSTWHRFRVLNASPSRPWNLQFRDEAGKEIGSDKCYLIGSDGGIIPNAGNHKLPKAGLLTDVAYRWDIICDFTGYSKDTTIYLLNVHDAGKTTSETPFFCYSHLIMKLAVSPAGDADATRLPNVSGPAELEQNAALPPDLLQDLTKRAMAGESDRSLKFGKSAGMWLFNDRGWDHEDTLGKGKHIEFNNVGQNTVELWTLESGGGWIHPVHIHLVDFFCIAWQGADWDGGGAGGGGWQPCPKELINAPKDVIHIGANVGKITLAARYGPHLGEYMMHCHNGVHEDNDMFRAFMISDASKGLTFRTRPMPANYTLLTNSPLTKSDQYGDTRNTTWGSENGKAPAFTNAYARTLLERDYYHVFYPRAGTVLDDINNNIHLTTCGRGTYNANDDEIITPACTSDNPSDCDKPADTSGGSGVIGRRLLRSKHNW